MWRSTMPSLIGLHRSPAFSVLYTPPTGDAAYAIRSSTGSTTIAFTDPPSGPWLVHRLTPPEAAIEIAVRTTSKKCSLDRMTSPFVKYKLGDEIPEDPDEIIKTFWEDSCGGLY